MQENCAMWSEGWYNDSDTSVPLFLDWGSADTVSIGGSFCSWACHTVIYMECEAKWSIILRLVCTLGCRTDSVVVGRADFAHMGGDILELEFTLVESFVWNLGGVGKGSALGVGWIEQRGGGLRFADG